MILNISSVTHNIKAKRDIVETPKLTDNDIVYITGEIAYEKIPNGQKTVSIPHIFAKQIIRMENDNDGESLELLEKGRIFMNQISSFGLSVRYDVILIQSFSLVFITCIVI